MNRAALVALQAVTAVLSGGTAVVYVVLSARTMPRLAVLADRVGIERMQHINRVALQPPFMTCFFGAALGSVVLVALVVAGRGGPAAGVAVAAALLYLAGFGLTVAYHVPLNDRLARLDPGALDSVAVWRAYLVGWTRANTVRAVLSAGCALLLVGAAVGSARSGR
ncbi:DUF1772 domain-containing protein [Lapillicoccus jejuensis]|uniref:Putative membrane protein n=1 Tax=Lapillicoccus jejuensis TaxID=402171 RepID=A0A542DY87_9MICO|nr:anthrone oxygenase family protein [Lapillicoccus jejuensis]TQJ08061.1 putative membrane protein [Lapillicoccus jejuensis]